MLRALAPLAALLLTLAPLAIAPAAHAAEPPAAGPASLGQTVIVHSKILGEDRRIYVYRPDNGARAEPSEGPYPVLYLLDGDRQFPMVAGLVDYLSKIDISMPRLVVVGIDTNGYDRMRDLTPTHSDRSEPGGPIDAGPASPTRTTGGGERFLQFLRQEVRPQVEGPEGAPYRILAGHSLGGLLTVHALLDQSEAFDAYVAISPSLWWDDERLIREAPGKLTPGRLAGKRLFLSIAGEGGRFGEDLDRFDKLLTDGAASGLRLTYARYPDQTHAGVPAKAFLDAWRALYPRWLSPQTDRTMAQTRAFYEGLSREYGYRIAPPEGLVNARGYQALGDKPARLDEALAFFELNVADHPRSANAQDSLGDGYLAAGRKADAATAYRRALAIDPSLADTARKAKALAAEGF